MFQAKIRILHPLDCAARVIDAEQIGETEVLSLCAPLVVKARFVSGDQTNTSLNRSAKLVALFVRQGCNVWQNERLELLNMWPVEQTIVNHLERNSSFDE